MPTYQYACTACEHELEAVQSFTDDALTECPACQGRLRKVFGSVGVVFKGSGFYRTDSRAESRAGRNGKGGPAGEGKAESKKEPAAKDSGASKDSSSSSTSGSGSTGGDSKPKAAAATSSS